MQPAYPQKLFHIFRCNDPCTPRRSTTAYETKILQGVVNQVALVFRTPHVLRLVAISLKRDADPIACQLPEDVVISEGDLAFARKALCGLPQLELVEQLGPEARVIRSTDEYTGTPTSSKPVRIQMRAERAYVLWMLAALASEQSPAYRQAFAWAVWVLLHGMMHLVRERAFSFAWEKVTPPRLCSDNRPQTELWEGAPYGILVASSSRSLPSTPSKAANPEPAQSASLPARAQPASLPSTPIARALKGESGPWFEDQLTHGCSFEAHDSAPFTVGQTSSLIKVPEELILYRVTSIFAKRRQPRGKYDLWTVNTTDLLTPIKLLDGLCDAQTVEDVEVVLEGLVRAIQDTPPLVMADTPAVCHKGGVEDRALQDVFDAHAAAYNKDVREYLEALKVRAATPDPPEGEEGEDADACDR
ncbi:hypothetical protein C8R44DRAFT_18490 [Mycena epipterygia]|nr:hypothetical protein C8R44DRAFT_18490 [Mycena epipterygia]